MNSEASPTDRDPVSIATIGIYAAPVGAVFFSSFLISTFFMKFATDFLLIAPATAGTILLVGQGWDALNDPPIGHLSDRTRTRWGRRRPWIFASAIPLALFTVALWSPPSWLDDAQIVAWTLVAFLLYRTFYSTFRVPHLALGAEISRGYHDRTRVFGGSQIVETIGLLGATITIGIVENAIDPRETMARISIVMAVAIVAFVLGATAFIREPESHQKPDNSGSFAVFADVLRNPHARLLLFVFLLEQIGQTLVLGSMPYFSDWVLRTPGQTATYMGTTVIVMLAAIPIWIRLSRRFGKKQVWLFSMCVRGALLANVGFIGEGDVALIIGLGAMIGVSAACGTVIGPSLKADIVDWDEARSGARREGAYFSTWNFAQKGAGALGGWLLGVSLAYYGYDAQSVEQSADTIFGIQFAFAYAPVLLTILSAGLLWRFSLDERAHSEAIQAAQADR